MASNKLNSAYKWLLDAAQTSFEEREVGEEHEHAIDAMLLVSIDDADVE